MIGEFPLLLRTFQQLSPEQLESPHTSHLLTRQYRGVPPRGSNLEILSLKEGNFSEDFEKGNGKNLQEIDIEFS